MPRNLEIGLTLRSCLFSNNDTKTTTKEDHSLNQLQGSHRKAAYALKINVESNVKKSGLERVGFLTLTFKDHVTSPKEAYRRFKSFNTHVLSKRYDWWISVFERQKSGRIHFHLLVGLPEDIREGFNFEEVEKGNYRSANV